MSILVVGSIGIDDVKTPFDERKAILGGSASYASVAASFFAPVRLVGVVGDDFPKKFRQVWADRDIDLDGLQTQKGETFRWSGEYSYDFNSRKTLSIALNVFEHFQPKLPDSYRGTPFVMLGNIAPKLQAHVLDQMEKPKFVMADTMDLWIETAKSDLLELLKRVDALCLNDSEARELTRETSLIKAGQRIMDLGPRYVIIKKGEHGALLFSRNEFFTAPAYPLEDIHDPTGAGDSFAGGIVGYLAGQPKIDFTALKKAIVYGSVVASFTVEAFSLDRLCQLKQADIEERYQSIKVMSYFDDVNF
ncbi:MAG: bifunctional hydroxymethylpyrimidine kinase/phosphomethylpyrimidine kinase [Verrucomicrobiae bacterium]|nr:bifunctional hydroxymethylpyrimidine kinase/phosphomethylpyrimidine kinase [Verrucomicrobiae bacterium]